MKIIETVDLSKEGNDHYIHKSVSLIEEFGMYAVVVCRRDTGWSSYQRIDVTTPTMDFELAKRIYDDKKEAM